MRKFHRVAGEVQQHLAEARRVTGDSRRYILCDFKLNLDIFISVAIKLRGLHDVAHSLGQIEIDPAQGNAVGFDAGKI